jgi:carbonic anhydrase/acetyltransferase-like protein (isoleucine patch superfamily)
MDSRLIALGPQRPQVDTSAWVAPTATLVGAVTLSAQVSIWYAAVLRGDGDEIAVGRGSNVQDGAVIHADPGFPVSVGRDVSVGHRAVLHGCRIGNEALVGMGAVILNGAEIGAGCLLAAGAVVLEGARFEPGTLIAGVPATARRTLRTDHEGHHLPRQRRPRRAQLVDRELPAPGPGEVRVRVAVSGVNPTDWKTRSGATNPKLFPEVTPHLDGAGVIDAVGAGVDQGRVGQRVWLFMATAGRPTGTAAEFTVVPAEQAVPLPDEADFDVGASLGVPALTAHRALTVAEDGPRRLRPGALDGQVVLAAGGAGSAQRGRLAQQH